MSKKTATKTKKEAYWRCKKCGDEIYWNTHKKMVMYKACSFRAELSKILFSLIGKMFRGAQRRNRKEYFAGRRAATSGGAASLGVVLEMGSDFLIYSQKI